MLNCFFWHLGYGVGAIAEMAAQSWTRRSGCGWGRNTTA